MSAPTDYLKERGFILLEVVFSLTLLGTSLLLVSLAVGTVSQIDQAGEKSRVVNLARKHLETERISGFNQLVEKEEEKEDYHYRLEVKRLSENLKQLTVKIDQGEVRQIKLKTVVSRWH